MNLERNKSLLSDLIFIAKADGIIDAAEHDFIHRLGARMNLDFDTIENLFDQPLPTVPLLTELERILHFHKLLLVMNVDQETHEKEVIALRNFGLKMGILPGVIDQILTKMNEFEDKIIPSEELISIFRAHYN